MDHSAGVGLFATLGTLSDSCDFVNPHCTGEIDIRSTSQQPYSRRFEMVSRQHNMTGKRPALVDGTLQPDRWSLVCVDCVSSCAVVTRLHVALSSHSAVPR